MNQLNDIALHKQKQDFMFEHRKALATRVIANMLGGPPRDRVVEQVDATIEKLKQENPALFNPTYVLDVPVLMRQVHANDWRVEFADVDISVGDWVARFFAAFAEDEKVERRTLVALTAAWLAKEPKNLIHRAASLYHVFGVAVTVLGQALLNFGDEEVEAQAVWAQQDLPVHPLVDHFCNTIIDFVLSPRNQVEAILQKSLPQPRKMEACVRVLLNEIDEKDAVIASLEKRLGWLEHAVRHLQAGTTP